jgi:hypothetical protein
MLSKFEYDGELNPAFKTGLVELPITNIRGYLKQPVTPRWVGFWTSCCRSKAMRCAQLLIPSTLTLLTSHVGGKGRVLGLWQQRCHLHSAAATDWCRGQPHTCSRIACCMTVDSLECKWAPRRELSPVIMHLQSASCALCICSLLFHGMALLGSKSERRFVNVSSAGVTRPNRPSMSCCTFTST